MVEADVGQVASEFQGAEDVPVGVGAQVGSQGFLGFPPLEEHGRGLRSVFLADVAGDAAGLGLHRPLNGPKDLKDSRPAFGEQGNSECSNDHCVPIATHDSYPRRGIAAAFT